MRRAIAVLAVAALLGVAPAAAFADCPRASQPDVERQVMCLVCGVPLNLADSPQATQERTFINGLIARCKSTSEIKAALVTQYGPKVLASPKDGGVNAALYVVAVLVPLLGIGLAVAAVRRWSPSRAGPEPTAPAPSRADAGRLEAELARWER